ncbi:hypothetical protein AtNW77_Chr4g0315781 [Arabidopsis thaliana]|uniref:Uncharacterized protein n=1 Tax=Arabidopsis thaliana TaxID=3702 RepID=A0A178V008_ARATH|nr:hypothetical protein AXX17_AT4G41480 [Arabidopsis thaliana]
MRIEGNERCCLCVWLRKEQTHTRHVHRSFFPRAKEFLLRSHRTKMGGIEGT